MRIGIHKVHNRFPFILRYLWPRLLNGITRSVNDVKIYKWLWWFIELPAERNNKVTVKTSYNSAR
jgi:hypothetical protein